MNKRRAGQELSDLILSFYECLTDPDQLDAMMEMLTSWLDEGDENVVSPKVDYHADRAWRLLGEMSEPDTAQLNASSSFEQSEFETEAQVLAALDDKIGAEDIQKLSEWLSDRSTTKAILLRLFENHSAELVFLSRDQSDGTYQFRRTGPNFHATISQFVTESFGLSNAEFTLIKELLSGGTLREISDRLGKSWETTRSQVKSLTNKLGVNSQADILRVVGQAANLMPPKDPHERLSQNLDLRTVDRPDGRTICYEVDGPRTGKTLVYLHGLIEGRHWPQSARRLAIRRGWQIIRISRAGRGASSLNPKEKDALLQDHVDDVMAVVNNENIGTFSIFGAADGFGVGYPLALQHPERVQMIVGLEVVPPILSYKAISGFIGKMKTYGLASLYAPQTIKFVFKLAMHKLERTEDRYSGVHPLLGVELRSIESADGIRAIEANFQDTITHQSEGLWRDASQSAIDWAYAPANANVRPRAALIHCGNSMVKSSDYLHDFADRIGAPIYQIESYLPYVSASLPKVLDTLETT